MVVTLLENSITRKWITGMEKQVQISLLSTEMGGAVKHLMRIPNPFRSDAAKQLAPTIQLTIFNFKKVTVL